MDPILWQIGRVKNVHATEDGQQARGDVHVGAYADKGPNGAVGSRVLEIANSSPEDCGMSIDAGMIFEEVDGKPTARIAWCNAVDVVGNPGGNPSGLLGGSGRQEHRPGRGDGSSGTTQNGVSDMKFNARQRAYLASCGLAKDATDEQIKTCLAGLSAPQKEYLESLAGAEEPEQKPDEDQTQLAGGGKPKDPPKPAETVTAEERARIEQAALAADKKRRGDVMALAKKHKIDESVAVAWCDRGVTVEKATELIELAGTMRGLNQPAGSRIEVGEDQNLATLSPALADAMCLSAGVRLLDYQYGEPVRNDDGSLHYRQPHERCQQLDVRSPVLLARRFLREFNCPGVEDMSEGQILQLSINRRRLAQHTGNPMFLAMGTGDFVHALDTSVRNAVRAKYWQQEAEAEWPKWCHRTTNPDYREKGYVTMSEIPPLLVQAEGEDIKFAVITDSKQTIIVYRFARGYRFTYQSLKNGLRGLLVDFPQGLVNVCRQKENLLPIATLVANPTMADGYALFCAEHNNYVGTDAGAAPSYTTLDAVRIAMESQEGLLEEQDGDGGPEAVEIKPHGLLVPSSLWMSTNALVTGPFDIAKSNNTPNPIAGVFPGGVVSSGQLRRSSSTRWYGFAKPAAWAAGWSWPSSKARRARPSRTRPTSTATT